MENFRKKQIFIRFGEIPKNEKSNIYSHNEKIGEEVGVSVYECAFIKGKYRIIMPFPIKMYQGTTYDQLIYSNQNIYLVNGTIVGYGNDNEPLIKNITIVKDLTELFRTRIKK